MKNKFESMGLMVDCSRNAVLNVESIKKLIDLMNIMGYDSLQLYTEDTYEVEGEPYFGYKRGKYSINEIQEIDEYAKSKNVKLIPYLWYFSPFAILKPLYSCSRSINLVIWCVRVILPRQIRLSALFTPSGARPLLPPIITLSVEPPLSRS